MRDTLPIFWFVLLIFIIDVNSKVLLDTAYGKYRGKKMESRNGRKFAAFRGIPYAMPPVDSLRFSNPVPVGPRRFLLADYDKSRCIQRIVDPMKDEIIGVEECLHLNIYTPMLSNRGGNDSIPRYPVMVWIHGGGFQTGSGHSSYYSPTYLLDHDVVLVTLNYRLGPFGFLSTGDEVMPGNYGLKDQLIALKWVHEFISVFGGDADSVTLFGNGAGAASAYYFMMTPAAKGLFHRVIAQSGTPFNPWAFQTPKMARKIAAEIGEKVGCPLKKSVEFLSCLREKKPEDILAAQQTLPGHDIYPHMACRPVLEKNTDGAFLIREPMDMRHVIQVPVMMGFTTHEGALHAAAFHGRKDAKVRSDMKKLPEIIPKMLYFDENCSPRMSSKIARTILPYYMRSRGIHNFTRHEFTKMLSDGLYNFGIIHGLDHKVREPAPVFFYEFAYKGGKSHSKLYGDLNNDYGVSHRDELQYLFPITEEQFPGARMSLSDLTMVVIMTRMWYSFAKYGDPTPETGEWAPIGNDQPLHLLIGDPVNMTMVGWTDQATYRFWDDLGCHAGLAPEVRTRRDEL